MRTQIAKALQTRCKAIRRAVANYNKAALELDPPREALEYSKVSHYAFIEEFAFLKNTRNDIREKLWVKPLYREMLKLRHKIARAKEEVVRCNVETRRLYTSICDESNLFSRVLARLKACNHLSYGPVHDFIARRRAVNGALLKRIQQIYCLPQFSGDKTRGISANDTQLPDILRREPDIGVTSRQDLGADDSDSEVDDDDDEFRQQVAGMETFIEGLSR